MFGSCWSFRSPRVKYERMFNSVQSVCLCLCVFQMMRAVRRGRSLCRVLMSVLSAAQICSRASSARETLSVSRAAAVLEVRDRERPAMFLFNYIKLKHIHLAVFVYYSNYSYFEFTYFWYCLFIRFCLF